MPKTAPYSLVELCVQCCAAEPDDRPTAYDVYEWARELYDELKGSSIINPGDNQEDAVDENYNEKKSNVSNVTDIDGNNTLLEKETQNDGNNEQAIVIVIIHKKKIKPIQTIIIIMILHHHLIKENIKTNEWAIKEGPQ